MSTYNTISPSPLPAESTREEFADRPLFGQSTTWDRLFNWIAIGVTGVFVLITLLGAFISQSGLKGINIFFAICITISCLSHDLLMFWYQQGGVDPKFRILMYANTIVIFLSCVCANLYIYWP